MYIYIYQVYELEYTYLYIYIYLYNIYIYISGICYITIYTYNIYIYINIMRTCIVANTKLSMSHCVLCCLFHALTLQVSCAFPWHSLGIRAARRGRTGTRDFRA